MSVQVESNWQLLSYLLMKRRFFTVFFLMITFTYQSSFAKDLGVHGALFKISEESLLKVIEQRLRNLEKTGKLAEAQQKITKRIQEKALQPQAVANVTHTTKPRQFFWDPTLLIEEDIKDHQGNLIIAKGTKINPLDKFQWGTPIIFIDGESLDQLDFAKAFKDQKIILVKGQPLTIEQEINRPIYFDQGGLLVKKFGIQQVPCRISQQGNRLLVEELEIKNKKENIK